MKKREHRLFIRVTDEERNRILDKMYGMGIHSLSAYIRKMALDGYCLCLDLKELRRMAYLLQNCSNNLNQVAKHAFPNLQTSKIFSRFEVYLLLTSLQSRNRYLYNKGEKKGRCSI